MSGNNFRPCCCCSYFYDPFAECISKHWLATGEFTHTSGVTYTNQANSSLEVEEGVARYALGAVCLWKQGTGTGHWQVILGNGEIYQDIWRKESGYYTGIVNRIIENGLIRGIICHTGTCYFACASNDRSTFGAPLSRFLMDDTLTPKICDPNTQPDCVPDTKYRLIDDTSIFNWYTHISGDSLKVIFDPDNCDLGITKANLHHTKYDPDFDNCLGCPFSCHIFYYNPILYTTNLLDKVFDITQGSIAPGQGNPQYPYSPCGHVITPNSEVGSLIENDEEWMLYVPCLMGGTTIYIDDIQIGIFTVPWSGSSISTLAAKQNGEIIAYIPIWSYFFPPNVHPNVLICKTTSGVAVGINYTYSHLVDPPLTSPAENPDEEYTAYLTQTRFLVPGGQNATKWKITTQSNNQLIYSSDQGEAYKPLHQKYMDCISGPTCVFPTNISWENGSRFGTLAVSVTINNLAAKDPNSKYAQIVSQINNVTYTLRPSAFPQLFTTAPVPISVDINNDGTNETIYIRILANFISIVNDPEHQNGYRTISVQLHLPRILGGSGTTILTYSTDTTLSERNTTLNKHLPFTDELDNYYYDTSNSTATIQGL